MKEATEVETVRYWGHQTAIGSPLHLNELIKHDTKPSVWNKEMDKIEEPKEPNQKSLADLHMYAKEENTSSWEAIEAKFNWT